MAVQSKPRATNTTQRKAALQVAQQRADKAKAELRAAKDEAKSAKKELKRAKKALRQAKEAAPAETTTRATVKRAAAKKKVAKRSAPKPAPAPVRAAPAKRAPPAKPSTRVAASNSNSADRLQHRKATANQQYINPERDFALF